MGERNRGGKVKIRLRSQSDYDILLQQEDFVGYRIQQTLQNPPWWNGHGTVTASFSYRDQAGGMPDYYFNIENQQGAGNSVTSVRAIFGRNQIIGQDAIEDLLAVRKDLMTRHAPTWRRAIAFDGTIIKPGQGNSRAGCVVEVEFIAIMDEDIDRRDARIGPNCEYGWLMRQPKIRRRWTLSYEDGGELGFTIGYGETAEAASGDARMRWFDELAKQLPMA